MKLKAEKMNEASPKQKSADGIVQNPNYSGTKMLILKTHQ